LHDLVSGALVIAQNVIPVIGHALEDRNLADTALAALAIVHRVDAFLYQHLQNALVGRNNKGQSGTLQHDLDLAIRGHLVSRRHGRLAIGSPPSVLIFKPKPTDRFLVTQSCGERSAPMSAPISAPM
jgi:hypothetical protein